MSCLFSYFLVTQVYKKKKLFNLILLTIIVLTCFKSHIYVKL